MPGWAWSEGLERRPRAIPDPRQGELETAHARARACDSHVSPPA
jgi:hypothetical protein